MHPSPRHWLHKSAFLLFAWFIFSSCFSVCHPTDAPPMASAPPSSNHTLVVAIAVSAVVILLLVVLIIVRKWRRDALEYRKREAILSHEAMSRPTVSVVSLRYLLPHRFLIQGWCSCMVDKIVQLDPKLLFMIIILTFSVHWNFFVKLSTQVA